MSGHSHWATTKRQKAITDNKRGQLFTKLIRAITVAARDGGDIHSNFKLRLAVDKARAVNMPKTNIERAIERGSGGAEGGGLTEALYEGFGPENIAVITAVLTDNKNRTASEIKKIFELKGGRLGQPGSVAFLFAKKGHLTVTKGPDCQKQILDLIDQGAEEVEEAEAGIEVLTDPANLYSLKQKIEGAGMSVTAAELVFLAKSQVTLTGEEQQKAQEFLDTLDELDDVQEVYSNLSV